MYSFTGHVADINMESFIVLMYKRIIDIYSLYKFAP